MKTKEEPDALKAEVEAVGKKLRELTEDELKQVSGGLSQDFVVLVDHEPADIGVPGTLHDILE